MRFLYIYNVSVCDYNRNIKGDDYLFWQTQDKKTLKRINKLIICKTGRGSK
ncbi:MAG: type II toxin-antitoxin system YoeB family toxin [Clostridiales bacterium]|nr:type II toxin-antitoxin system YoeB family toxin [Clostridiales bacterium]